MNKLSLGLDVYRECGIKALGCYIYKFAYPGRTPSKRWGLERPSGQNMYLTEVNVDEISKMSYFPFPVKHKNALAGEGSGCWDQCTKPLERSARYRAIHQRFAEEVSWEETERFQFAKRTISDGGKAWRCETMAELHARLQKLESIYEDIFRNGYKPATQRHSENGEWSDNVTKVGDAYIPDEIRITIDRNGDIIRTSNGMHRLAMAKILDIETIPAVVQFRHTLWDGNREIWRPVEESPLYRQERDQ